MKNKRKKKILARGTEMSWLHAAQQTPADSHKPALQDVALYGCSPLSKSPCTQLMALWAPLESFN